MKKLLFTLLVTLVLSGGAFAQTMVSINDYMKKNSQWISDPLSVAYVFKRCGAVYIYASALTDKKDQIKAFENASNIALKFANDVLVQEKKMSSSKAKEIVFGALDKIILNYKEDGDSSYAATGEYTINNYIGQDLRLCKGLVESIN